MDRNDTNDLWQELMAESNLDAYIKENESYFRDSSVTGMLAAFYEAQPISKAELARRASMSEVYLHQLFSGRRKPSRDKLICLCIGMQLTLEESQQLLTEANYVQLYPRIKREAIISHGIIHHTPLSEINNKLFRENERTLCWCNIEGLKENSMFRKMRRFKQQISEDDCKTVLEQEKRSAFSVIGDNGYPYTIPINFYYDRNDNKIYFHGATEGHKVDAIQKCDKVCFTVWNQGFKKAGHWEWNAESVVVFGRVVFVNDLSVKTEKLRKLATKYYPTQAEVEVEMAGPSFAKAQLFAIEIEHMTGKLVNER